MGNLKPKLYRAACFSLVLLVFSPCQGSVLKLWSKAHPLLGLLKIFSVLNKEQYELPTDTAD